MRAPSSAFRKLVDRVWDALAAEGLKVYYIDRVTIASHCPVCRRGVIGIWFVDADPPELRFVRSGQVVDDCSAGCTGRKIIRWLA